jgi:nucleoside-diphosphate-sugar epimerase
VRIFITGATGFVGGALARRLLAAGHEVRALVRSQERAADLARAGAVLHTGDVRDRETLRGPMAGADAVMHVAAWYKVGVGDPAARAINVDGTRHVLEMMAELGVAKGVYTSTLAVNSDTHGRVVDESYRFSGRHLSVYDRTKADAHDLAARMAGDGVPIVIVQPGAVYGPGDTSALGTLWRRFLARRLPPLPARTAFCWTFIDDVAEGHVLALERGAPGHAYMLAGPAHTMSEAVETASRITGIPAGSRRVPPAFLRAGAALSSVLGRVVRLPPEYTAEGLRVLAGVTYLGSGMKARRELGWRARPLEDGLRETLRYEMRAAGMPTHV